MGLGRCGGTQVLQNLVSLSLAVLENTYLCTELPIVEARGRALIYIYIYIYMYIQEPDLVSAGAELCAQALG